MPWRRSSGASTWPWAEAAWDRRPQDDESPDPSRRRAAHRAPGRGGDLVIDFDLVEGQPQPFTTSSWRLGHVIVGVLAARSHSHFDGPEASYGMWEFAGTADEALAQLDREVERWLDGLRSVDDERMQQPCGPAEGPWGDRPFADLALNINREVIHGSSELRVG